MDLVYQKIQKKTKSTPHSCKCKVCKNMCKSTPCLGTPDDIEKIIDAGFRDKLSSTIWAAGLLIGATDQLIEMVQPTHIKGYGCVFQNERHLCELHDIGLKPTEGKLATHTPVVFNPKTNLTWNVAKEWISPKNRETINRIKTKLGL